MKLVNRTTMLQLPAGTLISKYEPAVINETLIKDESIIHDGEHIDFFTQQIFEDSVDLDAIYSTGSGELDLESHSRDGCFDYDELYIIWEPADIQATIDRLQACKDVAATFSDLLIPYQSPDGRLFSLPTPLLNDTIVVS